MPKTHSGDVPGSWPPNTTPPQLFSERLSKWLTSSKRKTLRGLTSNFAEKSFALLFIVLLAIPATPLPTGGVSHVLELIAMLLSLELVAGRKTVWLPKRWRGLQLPLALQKKALPFVIRLMRRVERLSHPRLRTVFTASVGVRAIGCIIFSLSLIAFLAPPFSGLDTLPALGAVIVALSIILEDFLLLLAGMAVGAVGALLIVSIGQVITKIF